MKKFIFLSFLLIALTGCAGNHLMTSDGECLTCFNNPLTGEGVNHEGSYEPKEKNNANTQTSTLESGKKCVRTEYDSPFHCDPRIKMKRTHGQFEMEVPVDVDLAYARIKRQFKYKTKDEVKTESGMAYEYILKTKSYKYAAAPGSYYTMKRDFADYKYNGELLFTVIEVYIERLTDKTSVLSYQYTYADQSLPKSSYEKELKTKINKALKI